MYLFSPFSLFVKEMYSQIYTLFAIKSLAFICDVLFPIIAGHELTKKKNLDQKYMANHNFNMILLSRMPITKMDRQCIQS